jgi:hypothetical protein
MTADLDGLPFSIVRRGFDRAQVEERLGKLLAERDSAHTARQNAVAEHERTSRELDVSRGETRAARAELAERRSEVDRLAGQVAELSTIPSTVDGMSDRLQQMVRVAQDEVNDMRARATRGAAQILSMAQAEADELRESSRQERRTFEADQRSSQDELNARLDEARTQLASMREEVDGQRARLDAELADRRAHDEQVLAAEIADRREVMLGDLATHEKRQREEAQRIVDAAADRARTLVSDAAAETDRARSHAREQVQRATEELEQLRALQHQVAEQLAGVRSLLDWTLPRINPAVAAVVTDEALRSGPATTVADAPPSPPVAMVPEAPTASDAPRSALPEVPADDPLAGSVFEPRGADEPRIFEPSAPDAPVFDATVFDTRGAHTDDRDDELDDDDAEEPAVPQQREERVGKAETASVRPSPVARRDRTAARR